MSADSSAFVTTLRTLDGEVTLNVALEDKQDMLRRLTYCDKRIKFLIHLLTHTAEIEAIVSYHLCLSKGSCYLASLDDWIHESFNVCLFVFVKNKKGTGPAKRVMIRFSLSYKVGEEKIFDNVEEKLRCEVATYI